MFGKALLGCNGSVGGGTPPAPVDLTQGLVAHYLLNNNADDIAGTYDGSSFNGVDFQGDMAKTDGVDDYITMPLNTNLAPFNQTNFEVGLSFWFRTDAITNDKGICQWGDVLNDGTPIILLKYDASGVLKFYTESTYTTVQTSLTPNTMYHIFITRSDTDDTWRIYLNGVLKATYTNSNVAYAYGQKIFLGNAFGGYTNHSFSNMRVYNVYKDQTFIDALYAEGYYPKPLTLPTTKGLISHYPLIGTAKDAYGVGGSESGTEYNGVAFVSDVDRGSVASFDGVDDYIDIAGTAPFTDFATGTCTISCWFYFDSATANGRVLYSFNDQDDTDQVSLRCSPTTLSLLIRGGSFADPVTLVIDLSAEPNGWKNAIVVFNSGVASVSLNDGSSFISNTFATSVPSGINKFIIGADMNIGGENTSSTTPEYFYYGKLSDIRIYDRVLNSSEQTALYSEVNEPTIGLISHYPLTEEARAADMWIAYDGIESGVTYVDDAEFGSVSYYNGLDAGISFAGDTRFQGISVFSGCFWIKTTRTVASDLISQWSSTASNTVFEVQLEADGTIRTLFRDSNGSTLYSNISNTTVVNDGNWHFVYFHFDGGECTVNIDFVSTSDGTNVGAITRTTSLNLWFGRRADGTNDFVGNLRNVHFFNDTLTLQEITDIYTYEKNFRQIDIDDGLVAFYPLAQNSLDNSYNEYDGTDTDVTYDDLSATFNGTTSRVSIPESITAYPITLCAWVKTSSDGDIISFSDESSVGIITLRIASGLVTAYQKLGATSRSDNGTTVVTDNAWHCLCISVSDTWVSVYVDGLLEYEGSSTNLLDWTYNDVATIGASRNGYGVNNLLNGNIANSRLYNKEIAAEQVKAIYNTEKGDFGL